MVSGDIYTGNEATLHSNLVIFKSYSVTFQAKTFCTLHSNLVIFKSLSKNALASSYLAFTFQSGYIQIDSANFFKVRKQLYIPIWLYSN